MWNKLLQEPETLSYYDCIIREQLKLGFIEQVENLKNEPTRVHYIPHHCIKKVSTTTPIRIVYDCSAKQNKSKAS